MKKPPQEINNAHTENEFQSFWEGGGRHTKRRISFGPKGSFCKLLYSEEASVHVAMPNKQEDFKKNA